MVATPVQEKRLTMQTADLTSDTTAIRCLALFCHSWIILGTCPITANEK